jgi:two-component system sensor histidine kinase UhpB
MTIWQPEPEVPIGAPTSLRLRLVRTVTLVLLVTLAIGSVLIYWHAVRKVETEMRAAIAVGSRIAANAIDDGEEISNPRRRLELIVADFNGDRHLRAILLDKSKMVALTSKLALPEDIAPEWLYRLVAGQPKSVQIKLPPAFDGYGTVILQTDPRNEVGEVWNDAKLYLAILFMFCGVVLALLYVSVGRALRPLNELTEAFDRIGKGHYETRVPVRGARELAQLETGFNLMAGRLAQSEEGTARLRQQLETIQEEERSELARNLHDEVSPLLFSVDVDATTIAELAGERNNPDVVDRARAIQTAVAEMKTNVKTILGQLRPGGMAAINLKGAIENMVAYWKARHEDIRFVVEVPEESFGLKIDTAIQSIVRESLSNAMKHAAAAQVAVRIARTSRSVVLEIEDDGLGLSSPGGRDGFGVIGMRERAAALGGTLAVAPSNDRRGVTVRAEIPIGGPATQPQYRLEANA